MRRPKSYVTGPAFRTALEERLKSASSMEGTDISRLRRQVSFDRLLARLFSKVTAPWVLKGGYALELRFKSARSTVDIDLALENVSESRFGVQDNNQIIREMLQSAVDVALKDWFEFNIGSPIMDLPLHRTEVHDIRSEPKWLDEHFHGFMLTLVLGDVIIYPADTIEYRDWLAFAGIERPIVRALTREQQFAEKLHAYTLPRSTMNTRVKDLVDMVLLRLWKTDCARDHQGDQVDF